MTDPVTQYYRSPERYLGFAVLQPLSENRGYFRFGDDVLYGKCFGHPPSLSPVPPFNHELSTRTTEDGMNYLPFDIAEVTDCLRYEVYARGARDENSALDSIIRRSYYYVRPLLGVSARRTLQRLRLNDWRTLPFPHWPVDRTVDNLFEHVLLLLLQASGVNKLPFIWFWPKGAASCAIVTHDVETPRGMALCTTVMDLDDYYGIKASFQVVPEERYEVTATRLESIRSRGFEVNVQDLNHDGHLYRSRGQFTSRARRINDYGRQWGAEGFRSAVLYRRQEWFDALEFAYDMSVPNVAHLDPQRGGCCTVMPYFIGNLLELPVTTTQDYSLFHILRSHSIDLWKRQIDLIMEKHGLISCIIHPDYITTARERQTYEALLAYLVLLREQKGVWTTTPGEVNRWWRQRAEMGIAEDGGDVRIEGPGKERACIAYASAEEGRLTFTLEKEDSNCSQEVSSLSIGDCHQ